MAPDPTVGPTAPEEDFAVVYAHLVEHVLVAAADRGEKRLSLPDPTLAGAAEWAVPRERLMALEDRAFVENCILLLLDRSAWPSEVASWQLLLDKGFVTRATVIDLLLGSTEHLESGRHVVLV